MPRRFGKLRVEVDTAVLPTAPIVTFDAGNGNAAFDGQNVTFSWRDYADHNQRKEMTLPAVEFLRRFSMHIVPPRFTRVRYYGFFANRMRAANLEKARALIGASARSQRPQREPHIPLCPRCKQGVMQRGLDIDPQLPRIWFDSS